MRKLQIILVLLIAFLLVGCDQGGQFGKTNKGVAYENYLDNRFDSNIFYKNYGDKEYKEWLERNGERINETEMKILEAIEKAASVLKDPASTEEDKARANKELQKTIDKLLGRDTDDDIQDILEEIKNTRLGDIGEISDKMQDVIDDLYKDPSKMSESEINKLLEDIDEMAREIAKNTPQIAKTFRKSQEEVLEDIKKMRKTFRKSIKQMKEKKMSKEERKDIADNIKDSLEDIISSSVDKKRNEENMCKNILNFSIGFMQSLGGCSARWAHLSRDAIKDNNKDLIFIPFFILSLLL